MRIFAVAISLLAAMPAFADEPVQVQLNVTLMTGPQSMLDRPQMKGLLPSDFNVARPIATADARKLVEIARAKCGAKLLAEPKLVTLSGRAARFCLSGNQQAVVNGPMTMHFGQIGTDLTLLPIVMANGHIHLESTVRIRNVNPQRGVKTAFGVVPAFDERSARWALELSVGQSAVVADDCEFGTQLILVTPTLYAAPPANFKPPEPVAAAAAPMPATNDQTTNVAAMLVREYQQACATKNAELATKLAHMAVELDPMCFNVARPVAVTVTAPPMSCPLAECNPRLFQPNLDFSVSGKLSTKETRNCLAIKVTNRLDPPTDAEVLAKWKSNCSAPSDEVEIVCEKVVDRADPPRVYPLVGQAQLHHCQWKCMVYYNDSVGIKWPLKIGMKTQRIAVVYIDKDRLECESHRN